MIRRVLECARAIIVHSRCVLDQIRAAGFQGPIELIPHGAWVATADRWACRQRLGIDETTPLIGSFGFLKPYKRIAESLRAFRRLLRLEPGPSSFWPASRIRIFPSNRSSAPSASPPVSAC